MLQGKSVLEITGLVLESLHFEMSRAYPSGDVKSVVGSINPLYGWVLKIMFSFLTAVYDAS